ncbi:TPA: histidine--tRNA ligase [Candidatus Bathyarchaeota archaeon]|nr:histidine--tRNA ligase [Candidatus Bathyarchaeota archaeon]
MGRRKFSLPRGIRDVEPGEMTKRAWVLDKIVRTMRLYGFQMVEPATIEYLETLEAKSGPDVKDEIYCFVDKAGRSLGLRFDLTVGMTRMVANRPDLPEPVKLCAVGGMWRYDEPQYGRYRYFNQWDAEIYGSPSPIADAEIISLGMDILEGVGLSEFEVRVSNRRLVEAFLSNVGVEGGKIAETLRAIDKLQKISGGGVERRLLELGLPPNAVEKIMEFISLKGEAGRVLGSLPKEALRGEEAAKGREELTELFDALSSFGKAGGCILDLSVVRGLDYYDGIVFEAYDRGCEDVGAIFGGGRFDKLCGIYGKRNLPATGAAGGIERLMLSLERKGLFPRLPPTPEVFVATVSKEVEGGALRLLSLLRRSGLSCDLDLKGKNLRQQLEYADSVGVPVVVIIGAKELSAGEAVVKDMRRRREFKVKLSEVPAEIKKVLRG